MRTDTRSETFDDREPRVMGQVACAICADIGRVKGCDSVGNMGGSTGRFSESGIAVSGSRSSWSNSRIDVDLDVQTPPATPVRKTG
jgi:hypothetical protein